MGAAQDTYEARHNTYERLATFRDGVRARHKAAESSRDTLAVIIARMVAERPGRVVTEAVPEKALAEFREKEAEVVQLREAWFDARDAVETYMGRAVTRR